MGNAWTGLNEKTFFEYEKRMLVHSGLPLDSFEIFNVETDEDKNFTRTIRVGDKSKPIMVLVHGYGGSGVMYWKIIKPLSEQYNLYLLDIIGMGGSSRPKVNFKNSAEADEYFIKWFESWRINVGINEKFILSGHSFGGYICGLYASRYHHNIRKLQMLSAAGVTRYPENFDIWSYFMRFPEGQRPPKFAMTWGSKVWKRKWSPFGFMRKLGRGFVSCLLNGYIKRRFNTVPKHEVQDYKVYLHQTLLREGSTEYCIFVCFDYMMFAHHPLEDNDRLGNLSIPISFFFGDRDWMMQEGGNAVVDKNPYKGTHSNIYIINNSDHHMYFDNPEEFAQKILQDLENLTEFEQQQLALQNGQNTLLPTESKPVTGKSQTKNIQIEDDPQESLYDKQYSQNQVLNLAN
eukprot:403351067